jgi:hypothetical protein
VVGAGTNGFQENIPRGPEMHPKKYLKFRFIVQRKFYVTETNCCILFLREKIFSQEVQSVSRSGSAVRFIASFGFRFV